MKEAVECELSELGGAQDGGELELPADNPERGKLRDLLSLHALDRLSFDCSCCTVAQSLASLDPCSLETAKAIKIAALEQKSRNQHA